ncbi:hypothetical protein [Clostridium tetani]|uniref:hypothetical protein n=1 Tax=Clostridium tetani TaxID=1513 RepID=UPI0024A7DE62|nr:hypothetical protein [Clostridium tetani]
MPKLIVTLKQNSEFTHFQGEQTGATIRGTEFKPKLDRFLIEHAFKGGFEEYKHYLTGYKAGKTEEEFKNKKSLNYKVRFYNMKNLRSKKAQDKYKLKFDTVDAEFFSLYEKLLNLIIEKLPWFLENNNFGSGQSKKNKGSFSINENNKYILNGKELFFDNLTKKETCSSNNENTRKRNDNTKRKQIGISSIGDSIDPLILERLKGLK